MLDNQHNFLFLTILTKYCLCITFLCVPLHYQNKQTMKKTQILKAETLGMIAFAKGQKCVAALDKELMSMIGNRKIGETQKNEATTIQLLKSWNNGWNKANIQAAK